MQPGRSQPGSPRPENQEDKLVQGALGSRLIRFGLPLLILAIGAVAGLVLMRTGPQAKPKPQQRNATLVEVRPVAFDRHSAIIEAMGTVQPARLVELKSRVAGEILALGDGFVPGGLLKQDQTVVSIDPEDYELMIRQLRSDVAKAEADLKIEQGNQLVAIQEYQLLGEEVSDAELSLMLRQPQLENLQAVLESARTRLAQAELDLARTRVPVPFDAVVVSREVNIGSQVSATTTLATLAGIDEYWVEALVPVSQLRWIKVPTGDGEKGSTAKIYDQAAWGRGKYRQGRVIRLGAGLEEQGRMARLLIRIDDPLGLGGSPAEPRPRLLLNSYVRVEIEGERLPSSVAIDRAHLRENDRVWVLNEESRLEIRPIEIVYRGRDAVYATTGLQPGELLVVSEIPAPVANMELRIRGQESKTESVETSAAEAPAGHGAER